MVKDTDNPSSDEVDQAISELLSHWTGVGRDTEEVVGKVMRDLPSDEHNQRHVLIGRHSPDTKSPVERFVESLDGDWLLVKHVAERLDMSESWVRTVSNKPDVRAPSHSVNFGRVKVRLYNEKDVDELRQIITDRENSIQPTEQTNG